MTSEVVRVVTMVARNEEAVRLVLSPERSCFRVGHGLLMSGMGIRLRICGVGEETIVQGQNPRMQRSADCLMLSKVMLLWWFV